ncbi:MAG: preprotein translocase subunit YajC [Oscillospiraceae bacterium]
MPAAGAGAAQFAPIIMMVLIIVVFYFILIRPQKKKEKALKNMIASLKVGDEVASIGGLHGKIVRIKDDLFVIESGIGTTKSFITIDKSAISRLIKEGSSKESSVTPILDDEIVSE